MKLCLLLASLSALLLLSACVTTEDPNQGMMPASGTPSPLNTSANPWTNVNPQVTGAATAGR